MIQEITRSEAEALVHLNRIISSDVQQNPEHLNITLTLADNTSFLFTWDLQQRKKSYFLKKE